MESEINSMERYTRRFNVRVVGIPEEKDENCQEKLTALFTNHLGVVGDVVENAHRSGVAKQGTTRHIIARLHSRPVRAQIIRASRQVTLPFRIIDDLSTRDLTEKKRVASYMKHLYDTGHRPSFRNGRVYSNGRAVGVEYINSFLARESQQAPSGAPSDESNGNNHPSDSTNGTPSVRGRGGYSGRGGRGTFSGGANGSPRPSYVTNGHSSFVADSDDE